MSIFDFFKHNDGCLAGTAGSSLKVKGPEYLRPYLTTPDQAFAEMAAQYAAPGRWFGQLVTPAGEQQFELHYDGWLDEDSTKILAATDGVLKLVAIPANTAEEILVFDKALYGWDAYVENKYEEQRLLNFRPIHPYPSSANPGSYRVLVVVHYNDKLCGQLSEQAKQGKLALEDGRVVPVQDAFDNAFDHISVFVLDDGGRVTEIISE